MLIYIELYLFFLFALTLLMLLGKIFLSLFYKLFTESAGFFSLIFYEVLVGLIIITTIKSISSAGIYTINILFLLPILLCLAENIYKGRSPIIVHSTIKFGTVREYCYLLGAITLIFFVNSIFLVSSNLSLKIPNEDLFFYSKISASSALYGNENLLFSFNNAAFSGSNGTMLYHFFDTWFNTLLIDFGVGSSFCCMYFVTTPILITLLYLGIVGIWENFGKIDPWKLLASIILLFTCGMSFAFFDHFVYMKTTIPAFTDSMPFSVYGRKLLLVGIFGLAAANLFLQEQKHLAIVFLVLTTIVYSVGTFIGLLGSFGFLLIAPFLLKKRWPIHLRLDKKTRNFLVVYFVSFFIFNLSTGGTVSKNSFFENSLLVLNSPRKYFSNVKSAVSVIFYAWLFICFCYSTYFLLYRLNVAKIAPVLKKLQLYIVLIGLAMTFGTVGLLVFYLQLNARQFLTNLLPFLNVLCLIIVILVIENLKEYKTRVGIVVLNVFILIFIYFKTINSSISSQNYPGFDELYSASFRTKASSILNKVDKASLIGYYVSKDPTEYNYPLFRRWAFLDIWGYSNLIEIPKSPDQFRFALTKYNLTVRSNSIPSENKWEDNRIKFLTERRLSVIVADTLQTWIPAELIQSVYYDEQTHESIYHLKTF